LKKTTQSYPIQPDPTQYSEVEWNLLKILKGNPKLSQSEMAEKLGMNVNRLKYYLNELLLAQLAMVIGKF